MTKLLTALLLATMATACATDDSGGAGNGDDALPKRGALATDPTIVSATAECRVANGPTVPPALSIAVAASDPAGKANLGTCAVTVASMTDQSGFGDLSSCYAFLGMDCTPGATYTLGITVSNDTGGVTTASVSVVATKDD
ncbi:MAG TPA: hypothetical protein VL326_32450 [Kofleriaceae bacterium]|jgi:hypothetical protein|nr:hypothetical protein [Kofleriaceae bacterium]